MTQISKHMVDHNTAIPKTSNVMHSWRIEMPFANRIRIYDSDLFFQTRAYKNLFAPTNS